MSTFFSTLFIVPAPIASVLGPILNSIWEVWAATWWFFLPLITGIIFWEAFQLYLHVKWLRSIEWKILEIKVPKNILKTPKAMEQIFAAAHTPYSYGLRWQDHYFKGIGEYFMSFELVGIAGETHFYLRLPSRFRNMMESAIFAQYPDAEIVEVDDYLKGMPKHLPSDEFDLGGYEAVFRKPNWYPLRTYPMFEESVEEQRIDPIGPLIEAMEKLKGGQQLWIQFVVTPEGEDFVQAGIKEINKIHQIEEKKETKHGFFPHVDLGFSFGDIFRAPFEPPGEAAEKHQEKPTRSARVSLTSVEREITDGIGLKISKLALKTTLRIIAIERKDEPPSSIMPNLFLTLSYLRQFNSSTLQATRPDKLTRTFSVYGMFSNLKKEYRKRILYERYEDLRQNHHAPIMNIEELATMFHFPITAVSTTGLEKIESKKGSPPAGLPIVDEAELQSELQ